MASNPILTPHEQEVLEAIASFDGMALNEYVVARGTKSGHAFADNRFSVVYDLTDDCNVDADSIDEADHRVADREPLGDNPWDTAFAGGPYSGRSNL